MAFTTKTFIVFMAALFLLYYSMPAKYQWKLLLLASYVFYAFASPVYLLFLACTTLFTYIGARMMEICFAREKTVLAAGQLVSEEKKSIRMGYEKRRKQVLTTVILLLLLMLGVFKYATFILENLVSLGGAFGLELTIPTMKIILPIGLSFYVFQSIGYCIDVYRGTCKAQENLAKYALFISFFPQLLQGPIGNYESLAPQLFTPHEFEYRRAVEGIQRVAWGFFKKLVVANQIEAAIGIVFSDYTSYSGALWIVVLILYTFELYADFSGYMDIANGCAYMLGITLQENFDTPLFSTSASDFWRRWHMTLGTWFRNYLFYPLLRSKSLSGLRKKLKKSGQSYLAQVLPTAIALLVVWLCTGIWHGAAWGYIVWGLYYGCFIILDTLLTPIWNKLRESYRPIFQSKLFFNFRVVRTFLIVIVSFAIFRPENILETVYIVTHWIGTLHISEIAALFPSSRQKLGVIFGILSILCVDLYHLDKKRYPIRKRLSKAPLVVRYVVYLSGLGAIALFGSFGQSAFIYFGF